MSFRSDYSLINHLVLAIVCSRLREKGLSCSGKSRCEMSRNIKETNTFKILLPKRFLKVITSVSVIVSESLTCYFLKCAVYGRLVQ